MSKEIGITKAAVGYHLHLLMKAGLVEISRAEAENTAFYRSIIQ